MYWEVTRINNLFLEIIFKRMLYKIIIFMVLYNLFREMKYL